MRCSVDHHRTKHRHRSKPLVGSVTTVLRAALALALVAVSGLLGACSHIVDPPLPPGAVPFSPAAVYARWWAMTEACSGATGSLAAVSWFETAGLLRDPDTGKIIDGYWSSATNRIVLSADAKLDGGVVRHEMLHALIRQAGHSRAQFLGRCAGVVSCSIACVGDAGSPPPAAPGTTHVLPATLTIGLSVEPAAPTSTQEDGFFTITVTATNPASHPVEVLLPLPAQPPKTFAVNMTGPTGGVTDIAVELDLSAVTFAAGETKQQVFDYVVGQQGGPNTRAPGTYTVIGSYGGKETAPISVVLQ
jgi:hypothetical protein